MVDVIRCFIQSGNALERLVGIVAALVLPLYERFDLDAVGMDADYTSLTILATNADVVAEFQFGLGIMSGHSQ